MTEKELDALMYRVLRDALNTDRILSDDKETPFKPSFRYTRQMRAMRKNPLRWAKRKTATLASRIVRTAAVIALVLFLGFVSILTVSPSARASARKWVLELYRSSMIYQYYGEHGAKKQKYSINALPEGFTEVDQTLGNTITMDVYQNADGNMIIFSCVEMNKGAVSRFSTENADVIDVTVSGYDGKFISPREPDSMNTLTWLDEEHGLHLTIDADLSFSAIMAMAESVYSR